MDTSSHTILSTRVQFFRILRREHPLFIFKLVVNSIKYGWHKYVLGKRFVKKKLHGYELELDAHDVGISRTLYLVGDRERDHRYMLKRIVSPGQVILDLGANVGYYVMMEHKFMRGNGRVIAVEPSPDNVRQLQRNVELNECEDRTTVISAAVSDKDGKIPLYLSHLSNLHSVISGNYKPGERVRIDVDSVSLETLHEKYGDIDLIRMDVEGFESTILRSLIDLNNKKKFLPNVLFELHAPTYNKEEFVKILRDMYALGYCGKYLACSYKELLEEHGVDIVTRIQSDGAVRYIAQDVSLEALSVLAFRSRTLLLSRDSD